MGRVSLFIACLFLFFCAACGGSAAAPEVVLDGKALTFSVEPFMVEDVVFVPGRELLTALSFDPIWDAESGTLGIDEGGLLFVVEAGNPTANLNNQPLAMKVSPILKEGQLMVPLETVVQALGLKMETRKSVHSIETAGRPSEQPSEKPPAAGPLVGMWSSSGNFGDMFDPASGLWVGEAYQGKWYEFRADGTFRMVEVASNPLASGAIIQVGKYRIEGTDLLLYDSSHSWYPDTSPDNQPAYTDHLDKDERLSLVFTGSAEIVLGFFNYYKDLDH